MFQKVVYCAILFSALAASVFTGDHCYAGRFKVLVVMSYEQDNPWCKEIKEGIDETLADRFQITYFYLDTKINMAGGQRKAQEVHDLYLQLQPKGVIAVDDNAQWMFVVPYLKDKVSIPVMFCGVNAEAEKYGYPASNVSGILERGHIKESLSFAKQLLSDIATIGFITKYSPSGKELFRQIDQESDTYLLKVTAQTQVKTLNELMSLSTQLKSRCDAVFIDSMEGILDENVKGMNNKKITRNLQQAYGLKIIGSNRYHVKDGALCAVVKTGQEQGRTAAKMLLKAMQGTPVDRIPITTNKYGKRMINVTVMKALGINPRPILIRGAQLIRTED